jgi:hypothetical protein
MSTLRRYAWPPLPPADGKVGELSAALNTRMLDLQNRLGRTVVFSGDRIVSASFTLQDSDDLVICNTTGGTITATLMLASTQRGRTFNICRFTGGNNVVITPTGGELINGATTYTLTVSPSSAQIRAALTASPGTYGWIVI